MRALVGGVPSAKDGIEDSDHEQQPANQDGEASGKKTCCADHAQRHLTGGSVIGGEAGDRAKAAEYARSSKKKWGWMRRLPSGIQTGKVKAMSVKEKGPARMYRPFTQDLKSKV